MTKNIQIFPHSVTMCTQMHKCDYCGVDPRSVLFSHIIIFEMIFDEGHSMSSINLLKEYDYYGKTNVQP